MINEHFDSCRAAGQPMITVRLGRKFATLQWDCITLDHSAEAHIQGNRGNLLMRGMYDRFCDVAQNDPGKPIFEGSAFTGSISRLLPETARLLAQEYVDLLGADGAPARAASLA